MISFDLPAIQKISENTIAKVLGIEIVEVAQGRVVGTMPVDKRTHQPLGLLHGGASMTLAETLASLGGWYLVAAEGKVVVGQEINANHMRSVKSGKVTGVAEVLHAGKTSQVWEIKITDENKKLICVSRCTLAVVTTEGHGVSSPEEVVEALSGNHKRKE